MGSTAVLQQSLAFVKVDFKRSLIFYQRISPFVLSCLVTVFKCSLVILKWLSSCILVRVSSGCHSSAVMRQLPIAKGIPERFCSGICLH